jgi:hypothetical protein
MESSYPKITNSFKDNQTYTAFCRTRAFITIILIEFIEFIYSHVISYADMTLNVTTKQGTKHFNRFEG